MKTGINDPWWWSSNTSESNNTARGGICTSEPMSTDLEQEIRCLHKNEMGRTETSHRNVRPLCYDYTCTQLLYHVLLFVTTWTVACKPPLSMGLFRQEYSSVLPFSPPEDLSNPRIIPTFPASLALAGRFFTTEPTEKPPLWQEACITSDSEILLGKRQ